MLHSIYFISARVRDVAKNEGVGRLGDVWSWSGELTDIDTSSQHADRCPNAATGHIGLRRRWGRQRLPLLRKRHFEYRLSLRVGLRESGGDGASKNTMARSVFPATLRSLADKGGGRFRGSVVGSNSGRVQYAISRG